MNQHAEWKLEPTLSLFVREYIIDATPLYYGFKELQNIVTGSIKMINVNKKYT